MEIARQARNDQIVEEAIAMRNAMNADKKEFETFLKHYDTRPKKEPNQAEIERSKATLRRALGG
jgi:hypothetical protein